MNTPYGIVWLNPFSDEEWTPKRRAGLVSVLVSIFRPNGVDLVDFRDFRDFQPSRVRDWESAQ